VNVFLASLHHEGDADEIVGARRKTAYKLSLKTAC